MEHEHETHWGPELQAAIRNMERVLLELARTSVAEKIERHGSWMIVSTASPDEWAPAQFDADVVRRIGVQVLLVHGDLDTHHAVVHFDIAGPERAHFEDQDLRTTFDVELDHFEGAEANFLGMDDLLRLTRAHWHCWADGHRPAPATVDALASALSRGKASAAGGRQSQ